MFRAELRDQAYTSMIDMYMVAVRGKQWMCMISM